MAKKKKKQYHTRPRAEAPGPYDGYRRSSASSQQAGMARTERGQERPEEFRKREYAAYGTAAAGQPQSGQRSDRGAASSGRRQNAKKRKNVRRKDKLPRTIEPFTFEEAKRSRRRRRREPSNRAGEFIYRILLVSMIFAACFFIASVFFEVKNVEVTGTTRYSPEYVASLSGVEPGDKLLFINKIEISQNIFSELPFVKELKVRRQFPNTVVIEVTERTPAAKLVNGGISYIIDEDAYLLDYTALGDEYTLPEIHGVAPSGYETGKQLVFEDPLMLESLRNVLTELVKSDWIQSIGEINLEKIYEITFTYANRYTIILGDASELPYKLAVLREVLARLHETDQGVIDLSSPEMARFQPYTS